MKVRFIKKTKHYRGKGYHKTNDVAIVKDSYAKKWIEEGSAIAFIEQRKSLGIPKEVLELKKAESKIKKSRK